MEILRGSLYTCYKVVRNKTKKYFISIKYMIIADILTITEVNWNKKVNFLINIYKINLAIFSNTFACSLRDEIKNKPRCFISIIKLKYKKKQYWLLLSWGTLGMRKQKTNASGHIIFAMLTKHTR